jgi:hypothetical protein
MSMSCMECGAPIQPEAAADPCPRCGSRDRSLAASDTVVFALHEQVRLEQWNDVKRGRWRRQLIVGEELSERTGEWVHKERLTDRDNNHYRERITDATGEVIHECEEPLSQHRDHGSAKFSKKQTAL